MLRTAPGASTRKRRQISFEISATDQKKLAVVMTRAKRLKLLAEKKDAAQNLEMSIIACHANGCPLDFDKWLSFDDFSFSHDVAGIDRHVCHSTGAMLNCFLPRCAKPSAQAPA